MAHAEKRWSKKDKRWYWRVKYKLPDGSYTSASTDDFGNRFTTERAAERYGHAMETDVERKTFINPRDGKITVAEWAELWLASIEVGNRSDKTYRQRLRTVILPKWGAASMRDVSTIAYTTWEKGLRTRYSAAYVKSVRSVFRTMMDDAVASLVVGSNPVPTQKAARRGKFKGKVREDTTVLATPRQAYLMACNAREHRGLSGYALVLTIAYVGLRIAEAAGLRREDVVLPDDGSPAWILLRAQHQYVDGRPAQVDCKYGSKGDLILPPFLADLLRELLKSHTSQWVFPAPKGGKMLMGSEFYSDSWRRFVDGWEAPAGRRRLPSSCPPMRAVVGVEEIVPHGLRHSMKVWLDEQRHPRIAVEHRMRHVVPGIEGTYSHCTPQMQADIAAGLQDLWVASQRVVVDVREWEAPRAPRRAGGK
ncbi:tyrosine-type recombinase/integrase [Actinacidiphila sp. ITFR-21]|uniref:tyrosine-type recombinase/integrase n=1 Tax=Actinacidiphila sp. ITFR-21 TaxID=3075199 RepID=UPI00288B5632|nr:site-specific integrase [Streptomyces sp. ITFR-21]WNI19115.1 site-specific integrase [Streptomyces sp. ITFR-21]